MTSSDKLVLNEIERCLHMTSVLDIEVGKHSVERANARLKQIVRAFNPTSLALHPAQVCKQSFIDMAPAEKLPTCTLREVIDALDLAACMTDELHCFVTDIYYASQQYQDALELLEF